MARKKSSPAQAQRSRVAEAIRARGESAYNIWLVRLPFEDRDLILSSDPQFETFYLLEGEPAFAEIRYLPQWYAVKNDERISQPSTDFAIVRTLEGEDVRVQLAFGTEVGKEGASASLTPTDGVIRVNLRMLDNHIQRIENWRRVIPCIRRVRLHATAAIERQLAIRVNTQGRSTLRSLYACFADLDAGMFYGAIGTLLRRRMLLSDLDSRPWSLDTFVWTGTP